MFRMRSDGEIGRGFDCKVRYVQDILTHITTNMKVKKYG